MNNYIEAISKINLSDQTNILMLAKSKLNTIEILISKALNNMEISHEEFTIILNEKHKYDKIKYKIINENENSI